MKRGDGLASHSTGRGGGWMRQVAQVKTFPNFSLNPWVEYSSLTGLLLKISLRFPDKFPFKPWTERGILEELSCPCRNTTSLTLTEAQDHSIRTSTQLQLSLSISLKTGAHTRKILNENKHVKFLVTSHTSCKGSCHSSRTRKLHVG